MTVLISGLGIVSPLGEGISENWKQLTTPKHVCEEGPRSEENGFSRALDLSLHAGRQALVDAGLWNGETLEGVHPERFGCTVSASKPLFSDGTWIAPDAINAAVANRFGLQGERRNVIAACATGAYSIALAASWIEQDLCDVVLAGSVEPYPHPLIAAGFSQMGVTSPDGITRPFDRHRAGFAFGEGAGLIVLEAEWHWLRREKTAANVNGGSREQRPTETAVSGKSPFIKFPITVVHVGRRSREPQLPLAAPHPPYAILSGWALGADSHSAVAFNSNGARIASVIDRALSRGGIARAGVAHVNAHGTATRLNDWIETQALIKAFGSHAGRLMISATKASTGHLLGASGSVEFIFTVLALHHQFIPPTETLEEADPECRLDYTPRVGHAADVEHALSLSFGFGGPIGALVVSSC